MESNDSPDIPDGGGGGVDIRHPRLPFGGAKTTDARQAVEKKTKQSKTETKKWRIVPLLRLQLGDLSNTEVLCFTATPNNCKRQLEILIF